MGPSSPPRVTELPGGATIVPSGAAPSHALRSGFGRSERLVEGTPDSLTVSRVTLDPGTPQGPLHLHERAQNTYLALEGRVDIVTPDGRHTLEPGDAIFIPAGVPHATHDPWPEPATFLAIYDRSTAGDFVPVEATDAPGARG